MAKGNIVEQTKGPEEHHEDHGVGRYYVVYLALLVFTGLTVWTGRMDLGVINIYLAMAIATTKATLVVLFFMHLIDTGGVNRLVFVVSVLFVAVLIIGVFGDLMVRFAPALPYGGPIEHLSPPAGAGAPPATH